MTALAPSAEVNSPAASAAPLDFIDAARDVWTWAPDDPVVAPDGHRLLSLAQWREARDRWPFESSVGVVFPNDADVNELVPDLARLALIGLVFPKWTDGRAYSQARLLRMRHRYAGQLRAVGDVIPDMATQLHRTGFDAAVLRAGESVETARRMSTFFSGFYQADAHEPRPRFARVPPASA